MINNSNPANVGTSRYSVQFTVEEMFENMLHYGHKSRYNHTKMSPYIHSEKDGVSIIDLAKSKKMLADALFYLYTCAKKNKRVVFVGTSLNVSKIVKEAALKCAQYYFHLKWPCGTLTNWETISSSLKRLENLEKKIKSESEKYTKKEILKMSKEIQKLERQIGGIRGMKERPDVVFLVGSEEIAKYESYRLGIPTIGIIDTDSDPSNVTYPIPANDDSVRSVGFILKLVSEAIYQGIRDGMLESGTNVDEIRNRKTPTDKPFEKKPQSPRKPKTQSNTENEAKQKSE